MADIVIRGMEMPKVCIDNGWYGNCPLDRTWCAKRFAPKDLSDKLVHYDQWNKLPSWCPLVPLPEGHGRLGDLDELQEEFKKSHDGKRLMLIDTAPTIVPAEGGEADGNA